MSDLDERLVRYARHLDERMDRFEVRADPVPEVHHLDAPPVVDGGARPPSHRLWLATAAAICLLVAGSLAWWRSAAPGDEGVNDSTSVAVDPAPDDPAAEPIHWEKTDGAIGGWSVPVAATGFKGGLLAASGNALFKPFSWFAPNGHTFEEQVVMEDGGRAPKALAADDSVAVAVGDGPGAARSWVTTDGRTWEGHELAGADSVRALAHTPLGFVVVGSSRLGVDGGPLDKPHPAAWSSPDGRTWTRLAIPDTVPGEVTDVASSPDEIVLVGYVEGAPYAAAVAIGAEWRPIMFERVPEMYSGGGPTGVAWTGDRFVAIGAYGPGTPLMWDLTDADTFAPAPLGVLSAYPASIVGFDDIAAIDGTVAVVVDLGPGEHGMTTTVWAATDGGDWKPSAPIDAFPVPITTISVADGEFLGIALGGGVWVGAPGG